MRKYLYLIKKKKIKSWLKFWLLTNNKFNIILSNIIEGTSFNLQNTVKRYFKIFNIFGNSVQDGTPSPDNPVPIHSVADDVNLFDGETEVIAENTYNSSLVLDRNSFWYNRVDISKIEFPLTISTYIYNNTSNITDTNVRISLKDENYNDVLFKLGTSVTNDNKRSVVTIEKSEITNEMKYLLLFVRIQGGGHTENTKIQYSTEATPYSPYNYGTFTIDFEGQTENYNYTFITKPLRSLPNGVKDTIEAEQHRKIEYLVFDGSDDEGWELWSGGTNTIGFKISNIANLKNIQSSSTENIVLSNYFKKKTNQDRLTGDDEEGFATAVGNLYFKINRTTVNSLAEWKIWLSTHPTEIIYELEEEVIEPYTQEQQEQYNKIKELYTFNGTTNIYSTDVVPPYLQIQYYMKGE